MEGPDPDHARRLRFCGRMAGAALAGGDDYDAANDEEGKGPVYFGFVRDNRGSPVARRARRAAAEAGRAAGAQDRTCSGSIAATSARSVRPDDISVSCDKTGYKQVNVARRNPPGSSDMNIETNCTMQRL